MTHLVILGAGGDLTSRYLIPALAELDAAGVLPAGIAITGVGRQPLGRRELPTASRRLRRHIAAPVTAALPPR